jgi:transposase
MPTAAPVVTLDPVIEATLRHSERAPSTPQGLAERVRIVLSAAAGQINPQIATSLGLPEVTVGKWREAFQANGLDGLEDASRSSRPSRHSR